MFFKTRSLKFLLHLQITCQIFQENERISFIIDNSKRHHFLICQLLHIFFSARVCRCFYRYFLAPVPEYTGLCCLKYIERLQVYKKKKIAFSAYIQTEIKSDEFHLN